MVTGSGAEPSPIKIFKLTTSRVRFRIGSTSSFDASIYGTVLKGEVLLNDDTYYLLVVGDLICQTEKRGAVTRRWSAGCCTTAPP
jgi:hypothetical protein